MRAKKWHLGRGQVRTVFFSRISVASGAVQIRPSHRHRRGFDATDLTCLIAMSGPSCGVAMACPPFKRFSASRSSTLLSSLLFIHVLFHSTLSLGPRSFTLSLGTTNTSDPACSPAQLAVSSTSRRASVGLESCDKTLSIPPPPPQKGGLGKHTPSCTTRNREGSKAVSLPTLRR